MSIMALGSYADEVKAWQPGDPLPPVPGVTAVAPTVIPLPTQLIKQAGAALPWLLVAGLAITVFFLYQKMKNEG